MKSTFPRLFFLLLCLATFSFELTSQSVTIKGFVFADDEPAGLIGVNILVKETLSGTSTDFDGTFELKIDQENIPATLVFSYTGYEDQEITVTQGDSNLRVKMESGAETLDLGVTVRGQKVDEKRKSAALTIESLDVNAIKQTAANNAYEGLGALKGVDLTSASLGIKVVNTRGFNSTAPVRILQTIDGVDNASPSVNFALGNFLGASDLDLRGVELVVGASSAFYGPNAFNGVIKMSSKDPFYTEGFAANLRVAERNQREVELRWADSKENVEGFKQFAYKLNFSYLEGDDWPARDFRSVDSVEVAARESHYAGYDAINRYGDEFNKRLFDWRNVATPWRFPGITAYFREGYQEEDLVSYDTENIKASGSFRWRTKPELEGESPELSVSGNYAEGKTIFQGATRFRLDGIKFFTGKVEYAKRDQFFIRAYMTGDGAGDTYNPFVTALKLNELQAEESEIWGSNYRNVFRNTFGNMARDLGYPDLEFIDGKPFFDSQAREDFYNDPIIQDSLRSWHAQTLALVNNRSIGGISPRLQPGTPEFDEATARINSTLSNSQDFDIGGSKVFTGSRLYHINGERVFTPTFVDKLTVGAAGRYYTPFTKGTLFKDGDIFNVTTDATGELDTTFTSRNITNYEYGFYAGIEKKILDEKITFTLTGRVDKNENFDWIGTPAASIVFKPNERDYIRLSFSSAIRNPTLPDQFLNLDVGPATFIGNITGRDSLITVPSFDAYLLAEADPSKLEYFNVAPIQPEKVQTFEIGYRSIFWDKVYVDASYYYNRYERFIGFLEGLDVFFNDFNLVFDVDAFRITANSDQIVTTQGAAVGLNYYFADYFQLATNYTWSKLNTAIDDDIIPAFNTPEHKYNIGLSGRDVPIRIGNLNAPNFGFNVNWKWVDGFFFEGSPQFTGPIDAYGLLDAQINYRFPNINTTLKIGASNILNNEHFEATGGPFVGRIGYIRATYQWDKK